MNSGHQRCTGHITKHGRDNNKTTTRTRDSRKCGVQTGFLGRKDLDIMSFSEIGPIEKRLSTCTKSIHIQYSTDHRGLITDYSGRPAPADSNTIVVYDCFWSSLEIFVLLDYSGRTRKGWNKTKRLVWSDTKLEILKCYDADCLLCCSYSSDLNGALRSVAPVWCRVLPPDGPST